MKLSKTQRAAVRWRRDPRARNRGGFWLTLLLFVALELLRPKPKIEDAKPSGLGDFRAPTATEGRPVPLIWGTVRIEGPNVIWFGDLLQEAITEKVKTGLFSSQRVTTGFRYHLGLQFALCMGSSESAAEQVTLRKVWIGDKLVGNYTGAPIVHDGTFTINKPDLFGGEELGRGGVTGTLRFHAGTNTQTAAAYLAGGKALTTTAVASAGTGYAIFDVLTEAGDGAGTRATFMVVSIGGSGEVTEILRLTPGLYTQQSTNPAATTVAPSGGTGCTLTMTYGGSLQAENGVTPAYRDICYVAPDAVHTQLGTSDSIDPWKWEVRRIPDGLALPTGHELVDGGANPANVIYELLTNADWGRNVAPANINTSNFTAVAATLFAENNGFSFLLDRQVDDESLLRQVEEQIGGVAFENPLTGQWEIKLLRFDYNIDTIPEVTGSALIAITSFSRVTWESTTNQVRVPFNDQSDDYKDTFGFAQDMANVLVVGSNISTSISHPGVKTGSLANAIAWRELRVLSTPLAQANLLVDRSFYGLLPGDPFAFTDPDVGFVKLPMRVKSIDYGELLDGTITIDAVQDVFASAVGVFDDPPGSGWEPPGNDLVAYPADEQLVFEAPRGLTLRDPLTVDPETSKVYAAARRQASESVFEMRERHHPTTPAGNYAPDFGQTYQFMLVGKLAAALNLSGTNPVTSFDVFPGPDTQTEIEAAFPDVVDISELGTELVSLIMIEEEFLLVTSSQTSAGNVQLNTVYRGIMDSVQADHPVGADVYMIFVGGGISDTAVPSTDVVDIKLVAKNAVAELLEATATVAQITMADRTRRPYPPSEFDLNSVTLDTTNVDLDGTGSGEDVGVLIDTIVRRDFRTVDEIEALDTDAAVIHSDFPTVNTTTVELEVRDGVTVLDSEVGLSGTSTTMRQLDILAGLDATSLPASLTFAVRLSHTLDSVVYKSRVWLECTATIASPLVGKHAFGELDDSEISNTFTVVAPTIDHVFNLTTSFTVGDVEYRINGGSWLTLITAGGTGPGTVPNASLSASDTIEVRHLSTDTTPQKLLTMTVSGVEEAYAVLIS
tara:strand:- start:806 stop:4000 length:3195 start_codon:yes stop_codon:yes gene_type:complete